ncbi:MAG: TonB-dependent receptor, partial [Verrucomicrobiae bacterium]|nr:TonB-dependent receptor [Verrucomicrobiae bacterium]
VGIKGTLGESNIFNYSVAYFTTTNNNIIRNIALGNNPAAYQVWYPNLDAATIAALAALEVTERIDEFQIQSGEEEAKGLELEFTATPIEGWDIRATYTNLDTQLLSDDSAPEAEGRTLPNSPEHNFNLFTRYGFHGPLQGLFIGGSADFLSERFSAPPQNGTAGLRARPRTLVNLFGGYRFDVGNLRYRLQLNVQNVTDEFVSEGNNLGAVVAPTSYRFSASVDF